MNAPAAMIAQATTAAPRSVGDMFSATLADPLVWAVFLGAAGIWLMLPRGRRRGRRFGALLATAGLVLFGWLIPHQAEWGHNAEFLVLAGITLVAAVATISARSPVYSAIWFAVVLLGTAGLFLFQGAQFLGIATVAVYAGAILVTFLFVLMLCQPEGHTYYDRIAWEALGSVATGALLVGVLCSMLFRAFPENPREMPLAERGSVQANLAETVLAEQHVAAFGAQMYGRHLIAVEAAAALLLAALVGAVAIVAQGKMTPAHEPDESKN